MLFFFLLLQGLKFDTLTEVSAGGLLHAKETFTGSLAEKALVKPSSKGLTGTSGEDEEAEQSAEDGERKEIQNNQ